MPYAAIPTTFAGRQYRSRLEARWAAFFHYLGWDAEYEPVDFDGWIPDFALYGARVVYVEVKPIVVCDDAVTAKIDASGCADEVLLVGQRPWCEHDTWYLGWLREQGEACDDEGNEMESVAWWWDYAVLGQWEGASTVGFCHQEGSFHDRISGGYDGGSHGGICLNNGQITGPWARAVNASQWRP
jgi:hypothetical protein